VYFNKEVTMNIAILKVAADSRPPAVAGAIAGAIREQGKVDVRAIGASAVNQAVKAVAIARGYLMPEGIDIVCIPSFAEVMIDGQERTAIHLEIVTNHGSISASAAQSGNK
jgi:Uncharacterized protein conserved in bacteria